MRRTSRRRADSGGATRKKALPKRPNRSQGRPDYRLPTIKDLELANMEEDEQDEEETEGNDWEDDCVPRGEPISSSSSSAATGDSEEEEEDLQDDIEEGDEEDLASVKSEADMDIAEEFENSPLPPKQREPKQHIKKDLLKKPRGRPSSTTASSQVVLLSKCSSLLGLEPAVPLEETEFTDYLPELQTGARLPIISYTRKGTETTGDSRSRLGVDRLEAIPSMTYAPNKPIPKAAFVKLDRDSSIIPPLVASSLSSPVRSPTSGTQLPRLLPGLGSPGRRRASKDTRNATYVTYKCPLEHDWKTRIEYDMDDQDALWLSLLNQDKAETKGRPCSSELFERVMDRLEKEWFELTKDMVQPPQENIPYPEDITCAVCDDGECENSNAIVFCDGCNLAVHQDCYGVPFIPEGTWLCRKCMLSPQAPVACLFCPNQGGAFKQTNNSKWCHLLCAVWIPECHISNHAFMEPIEGIGHIPKNRWKLVCSICKKRHGACIQCAQKNCFTAFHVTCARKAKFYMKMRGQSADNHDFKCFCEKHAPKDYRDEVDIEAALELAVTESRANIFEDLPQDVSMVTAVFEDSTALSVQSSPKKRKKLQIASDSEDEVAAIASPIPKKSPSKSSKQDSPVSTSYVIPAVILNKFLDELGGQGEESLDKETVIRICKYWSFKRGARQGAPLLKRLHLEPWTANASEYLIQEARRARVYEKMVILRKSMDRVRTLANLVRRREQEKIRRYALQAKFLERLFNPLYPYLTQALNTLKSLDRQHIFAQPVNTALVTDYLKFVQTPMDFSTMKQKLDTYKYRTVDDFEMDAELVVKNCMVYNAPTTIYYKAAQKLVTHIGPLMEQLRSAVSALPQSGVLRLDTETLNEMFDE